MHFANWLILDLHYPHLHLINLNFNLTYIIFLQNLIIYLFYFFIIFDSEHFYSFDRGPFNGH